FDQNGKLLEVWPTELIGPAFFYVDAEDTVYIPEHNGGFISILNLDGERLARWGRSEEHTSELQSQSNLVCRLLLEKKKKKQKHNTKKKQNWTTVTKYLPARHNLLTITRHNHQQQLDSNYKQTLPCASSLFTSSRQN